MSMSRPLPNCRVGERRKRRHVALGMELEADLEPRFRVAAVRVQVDRVGHDARPAFSSRPESSSKTSGLRPTSCTGHGVTASGLFSTSSSVSSAFSGTSVSTRVLQIMWWNT